MYEEVENKFLQVGINIEIFEMDMIPVKIEEHFVTYNCIPTEHKIYFTDDSYVHWKNGEKVEPPLKECSIQQINEKLKGYGAIPKSKLLENSFIGYISPLDNENASPF